MNSKNILTDFKSGIVVFLVALPLCLGIALTCNVPLFSGILAGVIGGVFVTFFSTSALSVSGPAAGLTAVTISSVATLGSFPLFLSAVCCAGALQIVLGYIKAGSIGDFIPVSVIKGMLAGIGIILIIKQLPHLVGYDSDPEGDFDFIQPDGHNTFSELFYMFNYITPGAVIVGIVSIGIIIISQQNFYKKNKILSTVPGPLLVVLCGIFLAILFEPFPYFSISQDHMVNLPVIKNLSDFKQVLVPPDFSLWYTSKFWSIALTLAFVASLESLLSVEAVDKLDPLKRKSDFNTELKAQGLGNILCGLLGALPVTAVIVRGSANINAGATSKLSAVFHALLLASSILFLPSLLMKIPNAALAAILITTGYKLSQVSLFTKMYQKGIDQFLPLLTTIVVMLLSDLLKGVGAGVIVAIIFIIRSNIKSSFDVAEDVIDGKQHYIIKLPTHITYFNKGYLLKYLNSLKKGSKLIIDGSINKTTDKEARDVMQEFVEASHIKQIEVEIIKYKL
ncbi:MAG: SulP family inorganic anion transporter [Bacteroidetes bacterium]|nr:SulP family inorganic anion transporter [Bacteroidota bacterium]